MKKIEEMTNEELQNALDVMSGMVEAKATVEKIKAELKARKEKEDLERKEAEAKREAEEAKVENDIVEKQKSVLGKYFKKVFYDTNYLKPTVHYTVYYKVIGVYDDKAIVSFIKKYEHSEIVSKAVSFVNISELLDTKEHYEEISRKDFNDIYVKSNLTFDSLTHALERIFQFPF